MNDFTDKASPAPRPSGALADSPDKIPFNRCIPVGNELDHIREALEKMHISGDGPFTEKCQQFLEEKLGVPKALLTTSCTHALEICAHLLDIEPGDEIIVPSYTFVSTINAFILRGARPVFADIDGETLNIDPASVAALAGPRTKAIVPVHYAGVGCDMEALGKTADDHGAVVVEDNAHGLFATRDDKPLGTFGKLATLSFHETKNFSCGEGGALLINDPAFIERAEIIREKGTDRSKFMRGEVQKYSWVDIGSSYLPSDLLAAFLFGQLERYDWVQETRERIWKHYRDSLGEWAAGNGVRLPVVADECKQAFHMFYLIMPTPAARSRFIAHLLENGVKAVFHYLPLHLSKMGKSFGGAEGDCPVAEDMSQRVVRLPFFTTLESADQDRVIELVRAFTPE